MGLLKGGVTLVLPQFLPLGNETRKAEAHVQNMHIFVSLGMFCLEHEKRHKHENKTKRTNESTTYIGVTFALGHHLRETLMVVKPTGVCTAVQCSRVEKPSIFEVAPTKNFFGGVDWGKHTTVNTAHN